MEEEEVGYLNAMDFKNVVQLDASMCVRVLKIHLVSFS